MLDALIAIALLGIVVVPITNSIASEKRLARSQYQRAVALEIVDGEMEALVAGAWRALPTGTTEYQVHAASRANLPVGKFLLTIETNRVRLEWKPAVRHSGGPIVREALVK
jgi:hypothetical protein